MDRFVTEEEFWDNNEMDDELLLKATQLAEEQASKQAAESRKKAECPNIDPDELAEITKILNDDDEDWGKDVVVNNNNKKGDNKFMQTQTVFQEARSSTSTKPTSTSSFQSSFDDVNFKEPNAKFKFTKQKVVCTSKEEAEGLKKENEKATVEAKKLREEKYQSQGEISFLRAELKKKDSQLENTRRETEALLAKKNEEMLKLKKKAISEIDAVKTEKEFLAEDLRRLQRDSQKRQKMEPTDNVAASQHQQRGVASPKFNGGKRGLNKPETPEPKRNKANLKPRGIDESFFEGGDVLAKATERSVIKEKVNSETQTKKLPKNRRRHRLELRNPTESIGDLVRRSLKEEEVKLLSETSNLELLMRNVGLNDSLNAPIQIGETLENGSKKMEVFLQDPKKEPDQFFNETMAMFLVIRTCAKSLEGSVGAQIDDTICSTLASTVDRVLRVLTKERREKFSSSCLETLKCLFEKNLLSSNSFLSFKEIFISLDKAQVSSSGSKVPGILSVMAVCSENPKFGPELCEKSCGKGPCFLPLFLQRVNKSIEKKNQSPSELVRTAKLFQRWYSELTNCSESVPWRGSKGYCGQCRSEVIKTLVTVEEAVTRLRFSKPGSELDAVCKTLLVILHQFWRMDPEKFVSTLEKNSVIQRRYIWITKQFGLLKKTLNFSPCEASLLADLLVECANPTKNSDEQNE